MLNGINVTLLVICFFFLYKCYKSLIEQAYVENDFRAHHGLMPRSTFGTLVDKVRGRTLTLRVTKLITTKRCKLNIAEAIEKAISQMKDEEK